MSRHQKNIYCFITDDAGLYCRANQMPDGTWQVTRNAQPYPITYNPSNIMGAQVEFATTSKYFSLSRSITYPLDFIKDGAAILRSLYFLGKGIEQKCYLRIIEWDGKKNMYVLSYYGRFDLSTRTEDPKSGTFTCATMDDSAWGILSQNDEIEYSIDCSQSNPNAVKVLIDTPTLLNTVTFQTVAAPMIISTLGQSTVIPLVIVNQSGDTAGVLFKNQVNTSFPSPGTQPIPNYPPPFNDYSSAPVGAGFMYSSSSIPGVTYKFSGTFAFEFSNNNPLAQSGGITVQFQSDQGQYFRVIGTPRFGDDYEFKNMVRNKVYSFDFEFDVSVKSGETFCFTIMMFDNIANQMEITPIITDIQVTTVSKPQPQIAYGLRAIDLLKEIVSLATYNRYTINSNFFTQNNNDICLSGDAIRNTPGARIYSSFSEWFKTFDAIYFLALRVINDQLWIEPANTIYLNSQDNILELGDVIDLHITPAEEYYCSSIDVGSPNQDYRHPSGRLEFNSTNTFSLPFLTINKKLDIISNYRLGCFDITFLILDYQGGSTQDNSGDKSVYVIKITNQVKTAVENISNFETVTIDSSPLEPMIKFPVNGSGISNTNPTIIGIAPAGSAVNIYVDNVLDGGTTADANGNWIYNIVTALTPLNPPTHTGIHIIDATYTDESGPKTTTQVTIDTSFTQQTEILYPQVNDSIYNTTPLIHGVAQAALNFNVLLDGVIIGNVTSDGSGNWFLRSPVMSNDIHTITADTASVTFVVDNNVSSPLITYIGSELDGYPIINNLPLIKGVAQPNTAVMLWLNYIEYAPLGTVISDANGNWSFQVVPVTYEDPVSLQQDILAPIINGENVIIATLLQPVNTPILNEFVGINVSGFALSRPAYSSISGVTDNTVFNTEYSPKRMLLARSSLLASIGAQQSTEFIYFQTATKNGNLATVLNGNIISENSNVPFSSLGNKLAVLEYITIKTRTSNSFAQTLYDFNNAGVIHCTFRGNDIYMLPIGSMKIANVTGDVQEWKLLTSSLTSYNTLLNLYKNGLIINLMKNSIFHSDYNSLHFVTYNYTQPTEYDSKSIYDDWFSNRNSAWVDNPPYIQKYKRVDIIRDQIITNGISSVTLKIYRTYDIKLIDTINYTPISPAPIQTPEVVNEATIDWSDYPSDTYFIVMYVSGVAVAITEKIQTADSFPFNTVLIKSSSSLNETGMFFSTGIQTIIRVEGLIKKFQPDVQTIIAKDEVGDTNLIYSVMGKKRTVSFGDAYGIPDYAYLKIANGLLLDTLQIDEGFYTLDTDEKINPSDDVDGHPLYQYDVNLTFKTNTKGKSFIGIAGGNISGVILIVDPLAMGLPAGSGLEIALDNEPDSAPSIINNRITQDTNNRITQDGNNRITQ